MSTLTRALLGPARVVRRIFVPEAVLLALLLWAPSLDFFPYLAPYTGLLAAAAAVGTAAVGWRFRRGRVVFGTA
ncbi:MAG: hypothetical protein GWM90_14880, partial [Gemmatimonadetes bacterium]|nr:hypothetical protein [Gemmatimonadota bacterium]NIQ55463.1 hypothetical protein [Gemmatimonadota bacterium]NIU75672.1 hypothetical protein [Gammaproteobacteria bacterium]NIX45343.1 hypothetical protein [Gemmatimonadota bacterium]NIY09632.1 hypothetical protein [Gemmatimonadota bacterium]